MSVVDSEAVLELKHRARLLQQAALAGDEVARARLRRLPELSELDPEALASTLRRRHALAALARELGFASWIHARSALAGESLEDYGTLLYPARSSAYWNIWSAHYEEAKRIREQHGGWLLAYKRHYFIVDEHFVANLGLDPTDPDWERIGRDWARPREPQARNRLYAKLIRYWQERVA